MQSAADDTGLPMLVVRAPFNMVWQTPPALWPRLKSGHEGGRQHSLSGHGGNLLPLSDSSWQDLGASDPQLASINVLGLESAISITAELQFIDPKGHTLTRSQNDALVAVFQPHLTSNKKGWSNQLALFNV